MTIRKPCPQASRMRPTSWGEATTPSIPASRARRARRRTESESGPERPTSARLASSWLVRTVTARSRTPPARASAAASSIARPPRPCRVRSDTPRREALFTAAPTVFGMSWYLRSRNTFWFRATIVRTTSGPAAVKSWLPILKRPTRPARRSTSPRASSAVGTSRATVRRSLAFNARAPSCQGVLERAHDLVHVREAVPLQVLREIFQHPVVEAGIDEVRGADLHGAAARDQELEGVPGGGDPADADDRDPHRARGLPGHAHRHRPDRG